MGGIGKTRLALHFATARWTGPVALCDLVAARGDADVEAAVLRAVGAPATSPRPSAAIEAALAEAPDALLLFDNAESALVETARMVELCLDLSPSLRVLVTSRAPLQIAGESRLPLFGLDPEAAGALLRARAEAALDDAAADAVLRRLDGIPLAVELAAARTALVGPGALASLLREQQSGAGWLRVLSDPSAPERQGAMLGVLEGTWALLPPPARAALARLSLAEDGFSLETAEALLGGAVEARGPATLDTLVRAGLLRRSGEGRLEMLPTVRAFAAERLTELDRQEAWDRLITSLLTRYPTPLPPERARGRSEDKASILAAAEWAVAAGRPDIGSLAELAWALLQAEGPLARITPLITAGLLRSDLALPEEVLLCRVALYALRRFDDLQGAITVAGRLSRAAEARGDRRTVADARSLAGYLHCVLGDQAAAAEELDAALVAAEGGPPKTRSPVLLRLAVLRRAQGDHEGSLRLCLEAANLHGIGTISAAQAWTRVATANVVCGDLSAAREAIEKAEATPRPSLALASDIATNRMFIALEDGDYAAVSREAHTMLRLAEALADSPCTAQAHIGLSDVCLHSGRFADALEHARMAVSQPVRAIRHRSYALANLAWVEGRLALPEADRHLDEAWEMLAHAPPVLELRVNLAIRADLAWHRGEADLARAHLARAEQLGPASVRLERELREHMQAAGALPARRCVQSP
jgi:predicted ATPase